MYKYGSAGLFVLLTLLFSPLRSLALVNDREITINTPADVAERRQSLIKYVWGSEGFPTSRMPVLPVIRGDISPIDGLQNLERVDTLVVEMNSGIRSYAHHFIPERKNGRVVIVHQGHEPSFNDSGEAADVSYGMKRTINGLLTDGYAVLAVYMPGIASFSTTIQVNDNGDSTEHERFFSKKMYATRSGSPMKYFLEPLAAFVNYLTTRAAEDQFPNYRDINMVGFSGGGWATTVYAAIDPRIETSASVAGSMPLYLRSGASVGDIEQTLDGFYQIAGYPDLYVLGSYGEGRSQVQVLNRHDWACFGEDQHDPALAGGLGYDEAVKDYESRVRQTLSKIDVTDAFRVEIDEAATGHMVTWDAIYDTILTELNGSHRLIGTATREEAFVRGQNEKLWMYRSGAWSNADSPNVIGVPSAIKTGGNYTVFYRNSANELVLIARNENEWITRKTIDSELIADPVAVSTAAGQFDVIVLKSDYKLRRLNIDGDQITEEVVSDYAKALGQPSVIGGADGAIDIFYRSFDRGLYHARKIASGPWSLEVAGGAMPGFPSAIVDPSGQTRVYVRGLNGLLWEASNSKRGWTWAAVSWSTGGQAIMGSPAASVADGRISVSARTDAGTLSTFEQSAGAWTYTDRGGRIDGSPTASPAGVLVHDEKGTFSMIKDSLWTSLPEQTVSQLALDQ
jgi:hypothetical protein